MKIVHIQTAMNPAGNAAFRLHCAMRNAGIESYILTLDKTVKRNYVYNIGMSFSIGKSKILYKFQEMLVNRNKLDGTYAFSAMPKGNKHLLDIPQIKNADVIYFHWICGGFIGEDDIESLAKSGKVIVFFMHDMWAITGGCHHSFGCEQYQNGCKLCPMFKRDLRFATKQMEVKKRLYSKYDNMLFVAPSNWMGDCARKSYALLQSKVQVISNVVDETIFKPLNKRIAKSILNLPLDKKIITFGCQAGTNNKFKGWDYLQKAVSLIKRPDIHILIYGSDFKKETQDQVNYPITFLGPIFDETKLALICNATDVFVSPSLAESFGLTFLENILCDTPVVGFNNTAIPELVKQGLTGYLVENKNSVELSNCINLALDSTLHPRDNFNFSSTQIVEQHLSAINDFIHNK